MNESILLDKNEAARYDIDWECRLSTKGAIAIALICWLIGIIGGMVGGLFVLIVEVLA